MGLRASPVSRPARVVPASLLAVALLLLGAGAAWLLGTYLATGSWPPSAQPTVTALGAARLGSAPIAAAAACLSAAGLALLLSALIPGDPARRAVARDRVPGDTAVSKRDLLQRVARRVERVDGVQRVRSTLRGSRMVVTVQTPVDDTAGVAERSRTVVEQAIADLRPDRGLRPRVRTVRTP